MIFKESGRNLAWIFYEILNNYVKVWHHNNLFSEKNHDNILYYHKATKYQNNIFKNARL